MIDDEALNSIERLHKLKTDGVISEADFENAKAKLLTQGGSPKRATAADRPGYFSSFDGELPGSGDLLAWLQLPLRRYADFNGRSTRKEFWLFLLVYVALFLVSAIFSGVEPNLGIALFLLGVLALFIPQLALQVRRFHDQDKSGWFALFNLVPYVGAVIVLVFMAIDGTYGDNQYGHDPLGR